MSFFVILLFDQPPSALLSPLDHHYVRPWSRLSSYILEGAYWVPLGYAWLFAAGHFYTWNIYFSAFHTISRTSQNLFLDLTMLCLVSANVVLLVRRKCLSKTKTIRQIQLKNISNRTDQMLNLNIEVYEKTVFIREAYVFGECCFQRHLKYLKLVNSGRAISIENCSL